MVVAGGMDIIGAAGFLSSAATAFSAAAGGETAGRVMAGGDADLSSFAAGCGGKCRYGAALE
jgi:hypothetical protein